MDFLSTIPMWLLCILVFVFRVCDVTLGTMRTLSIVKGHIATSVVLGFFEVMIWIVAVSQVIVRLHESWWLALAWAGGFATGNAVGIMVERRIALGTAVVRILSAHHGDRIADTLRGQGHPVSTFTGEGAHGPVSLVYAMAPRRLTKDMLRLARSIDPDLLYVSEPAHESNSGVQLRLRPVPHATGWRAVVKKK
jgi:uncharacterized protein YebE (UPF0316 family)